MKMQIARLVLKVALLGLGALAVGCDDPVPPSAQGAVKYRLGRQATGPICQVSSPSEVVGSININDLSQSTPVVDGEGSAKVICTIRPSGSSYNVSATVSTGNDSLSLLGTITPGTASTATVGITSSNLKGSYSSSPDNPCQIIVEGATPAGLGISPGKMRAIFTCPDMVHGGAASDEGHCAILGATNSEPGGYIFLDNCDE